MVGINQVAVSGRVVSASFGETTKEVAACSFVVKVNNMPGNLFVRVNVYSKFVERCIANIKKGTYIFVGGELMQRRPHGTDIQLVEIRAKNILWDFGHNEKDDEPKIEQKIDSVEQK